MFEKIKKLIAVILLVAMVISNSGMSVFAVSISSYIETATENAPDDSDITYRYYEEYNYSKTTYLMNDSEDDEKGSQSSPVQGGGSQGSPEQSKEELTGSGEIDETTRSSEFNEPTRMGVFNEPEESETNEESEAEEESDEPTRMGEFNEPEESEAEEESDEVTRTGEFDEPEESEAEEESDEPTRSSEFDEPDDIATASEAYDETEGEPDDIATSSSIEEEDFKIAPVQNASDSEISIRELDEIEIATISKVEIATDSEALIATDSEIVLEDIIVASESELIKEASVSEVKLFGASNHKHKICGVAGNVACTHTLQGGSHVEEEWNELSAGISEDSFISTIKNGGKFYLNSNIGAPGASAIKTIGATANVYLCLNGYSINNIVFSHTAGTFYVTNCKNTTSYLTYSNNVNYLIGEGHFDLYGVNKNIIIRTSYLHYVNNSTARNNTLYFYSTIIKEYDNTLYTNREIINCVQAQTYYMENCDITDFYSPGFIGGRGNLTVKNCTFKNSTFTSLFSAGDVLINFRGTNEISNNIGRNGYFIRSELNIVDGVTSISNNTFANLFSMSDLSSSITIANGAKLAITDNKIVKQNHVQAILSGDYSRVCNILGDLDITNNKFVSAVGTTTYQAYGINLKTSSWNIGSGKIRIKDNFAYTDENGEIKNNNQNIIQLNSEKTDATVAIFNQADSTKFSAGSEIVGVRFSATSNGYGTILSNWTNNAEKPELYAMQVVADKTSVATLRTMRDGTNLVIRNNAYTIEFMYSDTERTNIPTQNIYSGQKITGVTDPEDPKKKNRLFLGWSATKDTNYINFSTYTVTEDKKLFAMFENHEHKICGIASGSTCTHTLVTDSHSAVVWTPVKQNISLSDFKTLLQSSGDKTLYLRSNVGTAGSSDNTEIFITANVTICLNGYSMNNVRFGSNTTSYKVTITNCKTTQSLVTQSNSSNDLINRNNVNIFGVNKNITVKTDRIYYVSATTYAQKTVNFYNVKFIPYNTSTISRYTITTSGDNSSQATTLKVENCEFSGYKSYGLCSNAIKLTLKDTSIKSGTATNRVLSITSNGSINFKGNNEISNYTSQDSDYFMYFSPTLNIDDGTTTIENNKTSSVTSFIYQNGTLNIAKDAKLSIINNAINRGSKAQYILQLRNSSSNILGSLEIRDNKFAAASGTSSYNLMAFNANSYTATVGSGYIIIRDNYAYADTTVTENSKINESQHVYQLYSSLTNNSTAVFTQASETKFSANSYIGGIRFTQTNGYGVILKNWETNAEDKNSFVTNLKADTTVRDSLVSMIKDNDLVINDGYYVEFMYDKKTYVPNIATQAVIANGYISSVINPTDPTGKERRFLGWALKEDATREEVIDLVEYRVTKSLKLFATFEVHKHKLCGIASGAVCTHIDTASHTKVEDWEKLPLGVSADQINAYLNGTAGGLGQYIYLQENITLTSNAITLSRNVNLCLNGFNLTGTFSSSSYKIIITNCKEAVSTVGNVDSSNLFSGVNAEVYGREFEGEKNINCISTRQAYYSITSPRDLYVYNVKFTRYLSTSNSSNSAFYIYNSTGKKTITLEKVTFYGDDPTYRNSNLFFLEGSKANAILNLRDVTIDNYKAYNARMFNIVYGTVNLNGINNITNCNNYTSSDTNALIYSDSNGEINVLSGVTTIKGNKSEARTIAYLNSFNVNRGATFSVEENLTAHSTNNQGIVEFRANPTILGSLNVINNRLYSTGSATRVAAGVIGWNNAITIGSGSIVVRDNNVYSNSSATTINNNQHMYQIYSSITAGSANPLFAQAEGTKFSKKSFIGGIRFMGTDNYGIIMKNWDENAEDPENYTKQFVSDTYTYTNIRVRMEGKDLVQNNGWTVEFMYNKNVYIGIATRNVAYNAYVGKVATPSHPKSPSKKFLGWATDPNADETQIINPETYQVTRDLKLYSIFEGIKEGQTIIFGTYPQSSTDYNILDPIEWIVLNVGNNKALVVSKAILDNKSYHNQSVNITWEDSDLRSWLNGTFYNKAFSEEEKTGVKESTNRNEVNPDTGVSGGNDTDDKVFALSLNEARAYIAAAGVTSAKRSKYANSVYNNGGTLFSDGFAWLRTPGLDLKRAAVWLGTFASHAYNVNYNSIGVQPAFYMNLNSDIFHAKESRITWDLNGKELLDDSTWSRMTTYREGVTTILPTKGNFKDGDKFLGWQINDDETKLYTEIPTNIEGDIKLKAFFGYTVEFKYDEETYTKIATQGVIERGHIQTVEAPADRSGRGREFYGWATVSNSTKKEDAIDFDSFEVTGNMTLFAVFIEHSHKICGVASGSLCTHTGGETHDRGENWWALPADIDAADVNNYLNGIVGGLGEYIYLKGNINLVEREIILTRDLYICLNGYSITGQFAQSSRKIIITNCQDTVGTIGNVEDAVFARINTEVYGREVGGAKNIVIKGARFIDYRINSAREMIAYNAQFEKAEYMTSNDDSAISIADNHKKKLILERVEFKGLSDNRYTNTDLISLEGGNANSEIEFIGVSIIDYKSYSNNLIYANNGTMKFYDYNEISNCSNIDENNTTTLINVNSGEFTVEDTLIIENNRVHGKNILRVGENATFVTREGSTIAITKNLLMKYEENQGVAEFNNNPQLLGQFSVTENKILTGVENSNHVAAGMYVAENKRITIGNGIMTIRENEIYNVVAENDLMESLHAYQVYSATTDNKTELFTQYNTTKFNQLNYIGGVAFANELGHGIVLKDWENNAEEKETFEKQVVADNHYRKSIKTIVIDEDLAIHNVFTVEFFVGEGVYAPDISTQSVLINKKITSVATPSDPEHREREFIGWATKSDATINEVVDVDEYEIVEDTAFYAVFEYFAEHIHKICGYASGDFCFHDGLATHSGDIEYMPLTLRYVQKNGLPTSGNYYLHENIIYNKVATVSDTLNICLNGKSLKVDKFISLDRQKVTISNCRDTNVEINVKAGEMMFDNVVPSILSAKGTINVKTDCVVSYENATTTDRMEIYNVIFNPVSDEVSSLALFKTSYSAENGSRLFIASTSISNYNLTSGSLIVNRNATWFTKKLYISENNISSYLLNNEGAFTIDTVIASANIVKLNAIQNTVSGANITYRGNSIFANNKFYRQYTLSHAQITYNGNTSFVNNEFNIENGRYPFMQSNYTATNTYVGGETIFDGNKDVTPNNNAAAAFLYYEGNVDIFNSAKLIIRNNKLEKNTIMQSIFLINNNNYLRLTDTAQIRIEDNEIRQEINNNSLTTAMFVRDGQQIHIANGLVYIKGNKLTGSQSDNNHLYGLYFGNADNETPIFNQLYGTFSNENFIDSIAFEGTNGYGIITNNYNGSEDNLQIGKRLVADNNKRESLKTLVDGNKVYIGDAYNVEFRYDDDTYIDNISTQSVIAGQQIRAVEEPADPKGKGRKFLGWATNSEATAKDLIDITTYELKKDTIFYAVFEKHLHFICGVSTTSCTHTLISETHEEVLWSEVEENISVSDFKALLEKAEEKHIYLKSNIGVEGSSTYETITLTSDTYICLNGYSIHNVRFNATTFKLVITNCQDKLSYVTRDTDDGTIFNSNNVDIFGRNKNIIIKGYNIYTNSQNVTKAFNAYDVAFNQYNLDVEANQIFATSADNTAQLVTMKFEKVDITGFKGNVIFNRALGITLKNVKIHNNKLERTIFDIANSGLDLTLFGNVDIYENETHGGVRSLINNQKNITVEKLATLSVVNNKIERGYHDQKFIELKNGDKILGKLYVVDNKFISAAGSSNNISAGVYLALGQTVEVGTGSIIIKDNNVYTDEDGNVKNNVQKVHQLYSATTDDTTPIFIQSTNTKFNTNSYIGGIGFAHTEGFGHIVDNWTAETTDDVDEYKNIFVAEKFRKEANQLQTILVNNNVIINAVYSVEFMYDDETYVPGLSTQSILKNKYAEKVATPSDPTGAGRLFVGWATKSNANKEEVINIETYQINKNTKLFAVFDTHVHTICGVASGSCAHSLVEENHKGVVWRKVTEGTDIDAFKLLLEEANEKHLYLSSDIGSEGSMEYKTIVLTADTYICLNGHSIHNIRFNATTFKLVITNCNDSKAYITRDTEGGNMFNSNNVSVFGVNKNINIKGYNIYSNTEATNKTFNAYSVEFTQYDSNVVGTHTFQTSADNTEQLTTMNFEDVEISGFNGVTLFNKTLGPTLKNTYIHDNKMERTLFDINANATDIKFYGDNNIKDNTIAETNNAIINVSKNLIVERVATLSIVNNKIKRRDQAQKFLELKNGDKLLGSLVVKDNKFVSATGTNEYLATAIHMAQGQSVVVGSGSIVIDNNNICSDENGNTVNREQHLYEWYSQTNDNATPIFVQDANTKFSSNSFINGIAFNHTEGFGHIIDNWNDNTAADKKKFAEIFKSDDYGKESKRLKVAMDEDGKDVIISSTYYVEFFVREGVYALGVATQSVVRNGKVMPATPSLIDGAEKFLGWATASDATHYWDYENDKVTKDIKLYAKFLIGSIHLHKACGISSSSICQSHTDLDFGDHSSNVFYEVVSKADLVEIIKTISAESEVSIYLGEDVESDTPVVIELGNPTNGTRANPGEAVINICLNGHTLKGYTFVTKNKNIMINITNCQDAVSTITNTSNEAFAKGGTYTYTQGANTYTSSSRVDLRFFGNKDKNIKLVSDKIVGFTTATTTRYSTFAVNNVLFTQYSNSNNKILLDRLNVDPYIYNSTFENYTSVENIATRQSGTITYKLSNTTFNNISATNSLFSNATLDVSGEVKIENSSATRNMISTNINVNRMATLSVINNRLTRNVAGNAFINMTNSTSMNVLGGLVVRNNRVEGCNATNNQEVIAAINLNNRTMTVGTGSIIVRDNTSDGNDSTHANHHMYGIYSTIVDNNTPIISQIANTKHSKNTYIDGIAFAKENGYGHIINNWTKDTAEDINSYKTSFIADKFVHNDLTTSIYQNNLVIGNYTEYKVYFVSTISEVSAKLATQSVVNRGTASEPDPVEVAGYVFKGWFKDRDYTEKFDFVNTLITEDTPIYVKYEKTGPEVFKVVFISTVSDAVIEAAIATQNVIYRGTASEPIVSYDGYDFLGWFTDETYTTKFDFINTLITRDTVIYAKWRSNKFIVTLNARGGVFSNGRETKTEAIDVNEVVAFEEPTKDGYIFMYYEYSGEKVHSKWDYSDTSSTTLYAKWKPITYTIVFDGDGGQNAMSSQVATYGETVRLKNNTFTKDGYTFNRWKLGTRTFANGAEVSNLTIVDKAFVTLKAEWTAATYTINYRGNGATSGSMPADTNVAYGTNHTLKNNTYARTQYTFNGWSISENTQSIYGNLAVIDKSEEYRRTIDLYANWILTSSIKGTIVFDGNGGLVDGVATNTKNYAKGDIIQVPTLNREGYVFTGWTKDGSAYTLPDECNFEGTITLVANWRKAKYKIVYYANNNTDAKFESAEYEYDADVTIANINSSYTKDNYHFEYWSYGANNETKAFGAGDTTSKLSAVDGAKVELYAVWKGNNFTITFNGSNPTTGVVSSRSYAYGSNKSIPANTFAKTGYKFSGWTKTAGSDNIDYYNYTKADYIYETTNSTNITLYAVWVESSEAIDLVFDANGGNINGKTRIKAPLKPNSQITLPEPQSFGFTKSNWLNDDMTTAFDGTVVDFTEPKVIYANWNESTYSVHFVGSHADSTTTMDALVKRYSEEFELSDNRYERRGYEFVGWDVNADGKNVVYAPKQKVSKLADANANLRLYAVWEENTYIINYVEDGVAVASTSLLYTKTARLRPNAVPKAARDKGYEYTYSGGVKRFTSGQTVSLNDFEVTGSNREFNLVSKVEKAIYNIEFNPNGGTWEDGTTDVKVASISYGDRIVWPATPSFGNRKFNGYKVKGVLYTSETFDFDESVSFTADWDKAKCYIVFHKNTPVSPGGFTNEVKGNMATQSFIEGYDARIARNEFNVSGYTYIGWSTMPYTAEEAEALRDSESPLILKNTQIIDFPSRLDTTYHLYALWVRNKINITLAQNETNPTVADPYVGVYEVLYDQLLSEVPAFDVKTREGYTFTGKFTRARIANPIDKKNYNGTDYLTRDVVNRNVRDLILYPLWQNNEHRITLNIGDGTLPSGYSNLTFTAFYDAPYNTKGVAGEPKQANGEIVTPVANSADERMFTYWSKDSAGNNRINGSDLYLDTSVNTLYANYKDRERFTIRFSPGDGSGTMGNQIFVEGIPQALSKNAFTRSGYYFENWKLSGSNVNYWDGQTVTATSDMLLEAVWKKESGGGGGSGGRGGGSGGAGAGRGSGSIGGTLPSSTIPEEEVTDLSWNYNIVLDSETAFIAGTDINPTGWIYGNNSSGKIGWQYFGKDGVPTTGWHSENGSTYYFDSSGIMVTGRVNIDGQTRTFDSKGKLISGDLATPKIDVNANSTSSSPENGVWNYEPITNKWQYLVQVSEDRSEPVKNAWFESSVTGEKKWYATDANGYMLTGLVKYDGDIYFLEQDGAEAGSMVTDTVVNVGGLLVEIDASGKVVGDISLFENLLLPYDMSSKALDIIAMAATVQTGWQIGANGARYYIRQGYDALLKPTYEKVTGIQQIDGLYYCFDSTGMLLTGLKLIDGKLYYLHETGMFIGSVATGFVNVNGAIYYCDPQNGGVATRIN